MTIYIQYHKLESKKIVQSPFDMSRQANKESGTFIFNVLMKNR